MEEVCVSAYETGLSITNLTENISHFAATLGNALTYVYPAIMYASVVRKQNRKGETANVVFNNMSAILGLIMGAIGAKMALDK